MTDRYALIVGISEYGAFARLEKAAASAQEVARILQHHGQFRAELAPVAEWLDAETPKTMGRKLTGDDLWQRLLEPFFRETAKGGDALFYFCGHGFVLNDPYDRDRKEAFLATSDTVVGTGRDRGIISQQGGISFRSLIRLFSQADLRSLVVILDCCHSGSLLEESVVETFLSTHNKDCPYRLIAACRATESAYESGKDPQPYTIFTSALIQSLAAEQADERGRISDGRAWEQIEQAIAGRIQKPVSIALRGSITLVQYELKAKHPDSNAHSGEGSLGNPQTALVNRENPYLGLYAFGEADADRFFGREKASWDLLEDLRDNCFLAVVGDSGSGKSSLVKAGLLPKLRAGNSIPGSDQWQIESMQPGANPAVQLRAILARHPDNHPLLVFIDQFEEVFTLCTDESEKNTFMQQITQEVQRPNSQTRFVITIRGDFLTRCGEYEIADLINASKPRGYIVKAMTVEELQDAIAKPAAAHQVEFEDHLIEQMISEVQGEAGALPLLQHALQRLWKDCIETADPAAHTLTWAAYQQIGGVAGALEQEANDTYDRFTATQQAFTRRLFVQELVNPAGQTNTRGQIYTRRRVTRRSLEKIAPSTAVLDQVLTHFTNNRLLVTGILETPGQATSGQTISNLPEVFIEITHEAILEKWSRLKSWLQEDQEKIALLQQLRTNYDNWNHRYQQKQDALLMGALLANIKEKLDWENLAPEETGFVRKSLERQERDRQEKTRKERQRWFLAAGLLATVTLASMGFAFQARRAAIATQENQVKLLTTLADTLKSDQQLESLTTSIEALNILSSLNLSSLEESAYLKDLQLIMNKIQERNRWDAHSQGVIGLSLNHRINNFSSREIAIASSSRDGTIKLWTMRGKLIKQLEKQNTRVWNLKFSHDGKTLAAAAADGKIRLWNIQSHASVRILPGHSNLSFGLAFSPDDKWLVSSGSDGKLVLWPVQKDNNQPSSSLQANEFISLKNKSQNFNIYSVDYHPTNKNLIAYGGEGDDYNVWIWDRTLNQPQSIGKHQRAINCVRFSPDGSQLATCSQDGVIKVWSISPILKKEPIVEIRASQQSIYDIQFGPDSKFLISSGEDQIIRNWDIEKLIDMYQTKQDPISLEKASVTFSGHKGTINRLEITSLAKENGSSVNNDLILISGGLDNTIRLWKWEKDNMVFPEVSDTKSGQLLTAACSFLQDYLSINPQVKSTCR